MHVQRTVQVIQGLLQVLLLFGRVLHLHLRVSAVLQVLVALDGGLGAQVAWKQSRLVKVASLVHALLCG